MSDPLTRARDRIAELCDFVHTDNCGCDLSIIGRHQAWTIPGCDTKHWHDHPIPASLDFVSKVWRELRTFGYEWKRGDTEMWLCSLGPRSHYIYVKNTSDFCIDWTCLLADVLAWLQSNDPPAFVAAVEKIRKEIA